MRIIIIQIIKCISKRSSLSLCKLATPRVEEIVKQFHANWARSNKEESKSFSTRARAAVDIWTRGQTPTQKQQFDKFIFDDFFNYIMKTDGDIIPNESKGSKLVGLWKDVKEYEKSKASTQEAIMCLERRILERWNHMLESKQ